jgi:CPA2 family monovalent cation:H+ antiporter-2
VEGYLFQFTLLLGVLGLSALLSIALRLPVVPLYIVAGVILRGFVPHDHTVEFLGSLGVVFLLFSMGLEFSVARHSAAPTRILRAGGLDWLVNFPIGLAVGRALGWSWEESLFLGGIVYMTSSAVVSKCIVDFGRAARPETETILGILVFEDFVIAFYLVLLNALFPSAAATSESLHPAIALARSTVFVLALVLVARRLQGPLERMLAARTEEAFTLVLFTFVLLIASLAHWAGLSAEIGAFLGGLILGGTGLKERAGATLLPFQTLFAALFFVSFGLGVDLARVPPLLAPAVVLILLGLATKTLGGFLAGRAVGHNAQQSVVLGLSLIPKGEFSIVLASLAAASNPESSIKPFAGIYVLALSILGPLAMREADRVRELIFRPRARRSSRSD